MHEIVDHSNGGAKLMLIHCEGLHERVCVRGGVREGGGGGEGKIGQL